MNQPCCDKTWKLLLCFHINVDCNTQDRNKPNCAVGLHFWKLSTSEMTEIPVTCTLAKLPHFFFHITRLQAFHGFDIHQWRSPMSLDHFQRKKKSCFELVQEVSNLLEWYRNQRTWRPSLKAAQGILCSQDHIRKNIINTRTELSGHFKKNPCCRSGLSYMEVKIQ